MSGPEPGFGGPQHGLGSLASPPRPQRLQTVLGTPGVLVLLTEDSMSKAASADIYCVFIFSFMVHLKIVQLLF